MPDTQPAHCPLRLVAAPLDCLPRRCDAWGWLASHHVASGHKVAPAVNVLARLPGRWTSRACLPVACAYIHLLVYCLSTYVAGICSDARSVFSPQKRPRQLRSIQPAQQIGSHQHAPKLPPSSVGNTRNTSTRYLIGAMTHCMWIFDWRHHPPRLCAHWCRTVAP